MDTKLKDLLAARDALTARINREEAKTWILEESERFIAEEHATATANPEITVGQILAQLDSLPDYPAGYAELKRHDSLRYQVVRSVVEAAARAGTYTVGQTVNSRGRDSKCFSPAGWVPKRRRRPSFDVEVTGTTDPAIQAKLSLWLEENAPTVTEVLAVKTRPPGKPLREADLPVVRSKVVA